MLNFNTLRLNQRGLSLIELVIVLGVTSILMVGASGIIQSQVEQQKQIETKVGLLSLKNSVSQQLSSNAAWKKSIELNAATMGCLENSTCTENSGGPFDLYNAAGEIIVASSNPTAGFTATGKPCGDFSDSAPRSGCMARIELSWQAECDQSVKGACASPHEKISVNFKISNSVSSTGGSGVSANAFSLAGVSRQSLGRVTPVDLCSRDQKIYVGNIASFNGQAPDANGCVAPIALVSPLVRTTVVTQVVTVGGGAAPGVGLPPTPGVGAVSGSGPLATVGVPDGEYHSAFDPEIAAVSPSNVASFNYCESGAACMAVLDTAAVTGGPGVPPDPLNANGWVMTSGAAFVY